MPGIGGGGGVRAWVNRQSFCGQERFFGNWGRFVPDAAEPGEAGHWQGAQVWSKEQPVHGGFLRACRRSAKQRMSQGGDGGRAVAKWPKEMSWSAPQ